MMIVYVSAVQASPAPLMSGIPWKCTTVGGVDPTPRVSIRRCAQARSSSCPREIDPSISSSASGRHTSSHPSTSAVSRLRE